MQLCSWQLLHLKPFMQRKLRLIFKFKIWIFQTISDGESLKTKLQISNVVQLCSWQLFNVKSFIQRKLRLIFLTIEIQILQMTSDGEMTKTKVIDLEES